jgi:CelD/BcsL family acetyltransferase involved in cellulose biosynthesis
VGTGTASRLTRPAAGGVAVVTIDPLADGRWLDLLGRSPEAGPFHHPLWLELLREQYGYPIEAVCVPGADGDLVAGIPIARIRSRLTGARDVALPFSDVCKPATAEGAPDEAGAALGRALEAHARRTGVELELRAPLPELSAARRGRAFLQHTLALAADVDAVEARFSKSQIRRGIKKARRDGVQIAFATDRRALDAFFRLHVRTRQHQGVPTQPKRFIRRFEQLFKGGLGWVAVARWHEMPIAAAVFLSFNGTVVYKYGASDRRHLDKRPNNLLFREAIQRACEEGNHTLDFGRTDLDNEGLAAFKRAWGSDEHKLSYVRLGAASDADEAAGGGVPAPVRKLISRGPSALGQLIGAALYRHFG